MTKVTVDVIVSILDDFQEVGKHQENTKINRTDNGVISVRRSRFESNRQGKIRMEELHVDLKRATDYLISLFNETGQIYSCTRTKLGKLLSIAAFRCARGEILLFDAHIYKYNQCGSIIEGLNAFTNMEAYINFEYKDGIKKVCEDYPEEINGDVEFVAEQEIAAAIIKDVFINFGAYPTGALGECINAIVECEGVTEANGRVDLERVWTLTLNEVKTENDLTDYLFSHEETDNE